MEIKSTLINHEGQKFDVIYREEDPMVHLEDKVLQGVHAFCFCGDKLVLVKHAKSGWMPPGGGVEIGESIEGAVVREVKEETNMKVIHQELIGFQDIYEPDRTIRQTRSLCIVKPYGNFKKDPDGEITEIKLIDPKDYKKYFDWGKIGERIIQRALELKKEG
ncbi:MAG: NUDIX hydrolase [Candidatus Zambryskibacteria bacterium]|nr:NUDIX hydrolase [Candidatus Zambryskibacteria bacterium]